MKANLLWLDDEIEHLAPHIQYLRQKGFSVETFTHPQEALEYIQANPVDLAFVDEHLPGISGLEWVRQVRRRYPYLPIVMVTQDEAERLAEDAVGADVSDFLIKPVKIQQLYSVCLRLLQVDGIKDQQLIEAYHRAFAMISRKLMGPLDHEEWVALYKELVHWDLKIESSDAPELRETFEAQRSEAETVFAKYISNHYIDWVHASQGNRPDLSPDVLKKYFLPHIDEKGGPLALLLIDGMRYDQWKVLEALLAPHYNVAEEHLFYSILPTATQYARNSLFAGLYPLEIANRFPRYWADDDEEGGKNLFEEEFFNDFLLRHKISTKIAYAKVLKPEEGRELLSNLPNLMRTNHIVVMIFNFLDLMAHTRVQMNILKELAANDVALRAVTRAWMQNSTFYEVLKQLPAYTSRVFLTTDHGIVQVRKPVRVLGDRETTTNLRYKQGRNLNYDKDTKGVFHIRKPEEAKLPRATASATYLFACEDNFLVYPTNYNEYVRLYRDSYQHGGISLPEIIVPFVRLLPKK